VYRLHGIRGFYRGVTASYYGVSETMIYFVLYERLRLSIGHWRGITLDEDRRKSDFLVFMMASAVCKSTACCLAYPHGQCCSMHDLLAEISEAGWAYHMQKLFECCLRVCMYVCLLT